MVSLAKQYKKLQLLYRLKVKLRVNRNLKTQVVNNSWDKMVFFLKKQLKLPMTVKRKLLCKWQGKDYSPEPNCRGVGV